ncbi:hypothetical protein PVAP13_1NG552500 [Panicum virgatum]|uniref:Large ribosomal subunit protein bL9c n=1 Tax=Panicum virgatum TaxID=38727 RepID=A0A8T0X0K6_PANVG|nr:hypothetical protein PVAP13_1NG552500 [Panicum virgatum]
MASPSTLPLTSAFPSPSRRLAASRRATSLVIVAQGKVKKYRQVILTDDIQEVGKKGETLKVRAGFYRNFLLPKGKATLLTPQVLKEMQLEQERIEAEKKRQLIQVLLQQLIQVQRSKKKHNNLLEFLKPSGLSRFHAKAEKENKSLEASRHRMLLT